MEQLFIGELIRQRRLELGLKQCELCEGICEPVTMSRLESGKQTPGSNKLRMLMLLGVGLLAALVDFLNLWATLIPLFFPRFAIALRPLFDKEKKEK